MDKQNRRACAYATSPKVCNFQLSKVCNFRLPLTHLEAQRCREAGLIGGLQHDLHRALSAQLQRHRHRQMGRRPPARGHHRFVRRRRRPAQVFEVALAWTDQRRKRQAQVVAIFQRLRAGCAGGTAPAARPARCFAGEQRGRLRPITLLVGENSTGKTTFLGCYGALLRVIPTFRMLDEFGFQPRALRHGLFPRHRTVTARTKAHERLSDGDTLFLQLAPPACGRTPLPAPPPAPAARRRVRQGRALVRRVVVLNRARRHRLGRLLVGRRQRPLLPDRARRGS